MDSGEGLGTHIKKPPPDMKVAISSTSFADALAGGDLTQLEWLEGSASRLGADGIVFDRAHFPRTDREYVAQLRKVAIDLGLVPVAIDAPDLLGSPFEAAECATTLELAAQIGALFVLTRLPAPGETPPATFVASVSAAKQVVKAAKAVNVTLLVSSVLGTLAEDSAALRHFVKDVDSAWLRVALPAGTELAAAGGRDRGPLLVTVDPSAPLDQIAQIDETARPWLLLTGDVSPGRVSLLRRAAAKKTLALASVSE